jgi:hypothetical protein
MADQLDQLSNKKALELTRIAADNMEWSQDFRRLAISQVGRIASRGVNDESTYVWLFDLVRNSKDVEYRRAAAGTLATFITVYPARLKAFEEHLKSETDKEVIKSLQLAVKKGNERK